MLSRPVAVVVGSGSAGRRHVRALRDHNPEFTIIVVRRANSDQPIGDLAGPGVFFTPSIALALRHKPSLAIVASPASCHVEHALLLLVRVRKMLIEKPVATSLSEARRLESAVGDLRPRIAVGYHLRFNRFARTILEHFSTEDQSKINYNLEVSQHVAEWRPGVDLGSTVSVRADLGGGALLELSHEIDLAIWWFGAIASLNCDLSHGGLDIETTIDTAAKLQLRHINGARGTICLSMAAPSPVRAWRIDGPTRSAAADVLSRRASYSTAFGTSEEWIESDDRDRNEVSMLASVTASNRASPSVHDVACTLKQSLSVIEVIEAAQMSDVQATWVQLTHRRTSN